MVPHSLSVKTFYNFLYQKQEDDTKQAISHYIVNYLLYWNSYYTIISYFGIVKTQAKCHKMQHFIRVLHYLLNFYNNFFTPNVIEKCIYPKIIRPPNNTIKKTHQSSKDSP